MCNNGGNIIWSTHTQVFMWNLKHLKFMLCNAVLSERTSSHISMSRTRWWFDISCSFAVSIMGLPRLRTVDRGRLNQNDLYGVCFDCCCKYVLENMQHLLSFQPLYANIMLMPCVTLASSVYLIRNSSFRCLGFQLLLHIFLNQAFSFKNLKWKPNIETM